MLVLASHHKSASTFLSSVVGDWCAASGRSIETRHGTDREDAAPGRPDVLVLMNADYAWCRSHFDHVVHVVRNPLDLLISAYWSHLRTHSTENWDELVRQRAILEQLGEAEGLCATWPFLERSDFHPLTPGPLAAIRAWRFDDPFQTVLTMEDLVERKAAALRSAAPGVFDAGLDAAFDRYAFERMTGRKVGQVDAASHLRCGARDQWRTTLPRPLAAALAAAYADVLDRFYPHVRKELGQAERLRA